MYATDRDQKISLAYNEFPYERPRMTVNWEIRSIKMVNLQLQLHETADKKTAYNEVHL
jgi:hypothetical protein